MRRTIYACGACFERSENRTNYACGVFFAKNARRTNYTCGACERSALRTTFVHVACVLGGAHVARYYVTDIRFARFRYDPVALLCAVPATRHFFCPVKKRVRGVEHLVIGASKDQPGIHSGMIEGLRDYMYTSFFSGITMDYSEFTDTKEALSASSQLAIRMQRMQSRKQVTEPATRNGQVKVQPESIIKANEDRSVASVLDP